MRNQLFIAAKRMPYEIRRSSPSSFPLPLRGGEEQGEGVRCKGRRLILNQEGFSLLASILAMMGLAMMGVVFASAVTQHQYSAVNQMLSTQKFYIAEAGFELAIQELLDNQDYAFNGAAADGVIGGITNVPIGVGKVTVTKGSQTPPVFTGSATVGDITRAVAMTLDVKNLVTNDPGFENAGALPANWPEAVPTNNEGVSEIANHALQGNALRAQTNQGGNQDFTSYREQTLAQIIPANSRIGVRLNYMRDHPGGANTVNRQTLELRLVRSDGTTQTAWGVGPSSVPSADKGVWLMADIRGYSTSSTLTTNKVRIFYDLGTAGGAGASDNAVGWFDNIAVNIVNKSAWNEP